ncbi:MAG: LysR family transcriptional regulator [Spiribacter sp.]|nr:LysR family transcriptional regulator [Spiribacter sp.]
MGKHAVKLTWLEDFLELADSSTFSAAAKRRNITQPAFSRRIRMLEDWLGVELVDRRENQFRLTETALRFEPEIRSLVQRWKDLKIRVAGDLNEQQTLTVTTQHTLMLTHLPNWLQLFQRWQPSTRFQVRTGDLNDCVTQITSGASDLLIAYQADSITPSPDNQMDDLCCLTVANESLVPTVAPQAGRQLQDWPTTLRLINYGSGSFFAQVVKEVCDRELEPELLIETVCETSFAAGIKSMCLAGLGVGWLPLGLVSEELAEGRLISLADRLPSPSLDINVYRLPDYINPALDALWNHIGEITLNAPLGGN